MNKKSIFSILGAAAGAVFVAGRVPVGRLVKDAAGRRRTR
jgi:hypothetical protein